MDPLFTRKHNSYSEAFANYLANGLIPNNDKDVLVTIVKYPRPDRIIHLHHILRKGEEKHDVSDGYIVVEINPELEYIRMLRINAIDVNHFVAPIHSNGNLNYEVIERMIELLPNQVYAGQGVECWVMLRNVFLIYLYGNVEEQSS
jgi:hypothetical protein